jgi:hypothetical protein
MIPTKDELRLAQMADLQRREAELRAMAANAQALLPQLEMSEADAAEFLAVATPQQRASMLKLSEMLRAMPHEERLKALAEIATAAAAARANKRGKQ